MASTGSIRIGLLGLLSEIVYDSARCRKEL